MQTNRLSSLVPCAALVLAALFSAPLAGQAVITLGTVASPTTPGNLFPFNFTASGRYQICYTAAEISLSSGATITEVRCSKNNGSLPTFNNFQLRMAHSTTSPQAMSTTYDSNYIGALSVNLGPSNFTPTEAGGYALFPLATPFAYNGTDGLLIDISYDSRTGAGWTEPVSAAAPGRQRVFLAGGTSTTLTGTVGAGGDWLLQIVTTGGATPTLTLVAPATGSTAGGTACTLTGTDFTGVTGVTFGGTAATGVTFVSATSITCTSPAGAAGAVSVVVTTPAGSNVANTLFTYVAPAPEIAMARGGNVPDGGTDTVTGASAGTASVLTYTISNTGGAALTITTVAAPGALNNCTATITTQPAASVPATTGTTTLVITVTPTTAALFSCTVTFVNNDADENPYNWTISGTATGPAPEVNVLRGVTAVLDGAASDPLGSVPFGLAQTVTYTVQNTGTAGLNLTGAPSLVVVTAVANVTTVTVTTAPAATVAAAGSTTFVVTYTVTAAAAFSFTVSFANNDSDENPYNWTADGTGTSAPEMGVLRGATAVTDGGTNAVGNLVIATGTALTYTINNTGNAALTITNPVTIAGLVNCTATVATAPAASVAAAGTTTLVITVTPTAAGAFSFTVSVVNNDADENPYNWTVSGTGTTTGGGTTGGGGGGGGCTSGEGQFSWLLLAGALAGLGLALRLRKRAA